MRRFIITIVVAFFLFSVGSVVASTCSPDQGFDWCYEEKNNDVEGITCIAIVQGTYPKCSGESSGNKCVGQWSVDIMGGKDSLYLHKSITTWDGFWDGVARCGKSGCSGQRFPPNQKHNIVLRDIDGKVPGYVLVGFDEVSTGGGWCWQSVAGGYTVDFFGGLEVVDCLDGREECMGTILKICKNGEMVNSGKVLNKCGVECISNSNCEERVLDSFCLGKELKTRVVPPNCINDKCSSVQLTRTKVCEFSCGEVEGEAQCLETKPIFQEPIFLIVGGVLVLLGIGGVVLFFRRRR